MKSIKIQVHKTILALIVLASVGCVKAINAQSAGAHKIIFPHPFAFAIDDMGWNVGYDAGDVDHQGPYRIGIDRKMDINDYKCIVEVGKSVGVRIQGLFVLAEMDRTNFLAKHPTTTWQGSNWDNSKNVSQEQIDIMNYVKESAAWLEFGLHGVGHEYWLDGKKNRAEWYSTDDNKPWSEASLQEHISCFKELMAQYGLTPENGQSFPESFVPCAYGYYWNPTGQYSTGKVMAQAGVKYVNTLFDYITELNPPAEKNGGGFDQGVMVINRINYGNNWYALASLPTVPLAEQQSDIIESHWSNWLAQDQFLQPDVNQQWIDYYHMVQGDSLRYVAKNTEQFFSQWLYNKYSKVTEATPGIVTIDNTQMLDEIYTNNLLENMVLKIKLDTLQHVSSATIDGKNVCSYYEESGYGFIYLPKLEKRVYKLEYKTGAAQMPVYIWNKGTYNVYALNVDKKAVKSTVRVYGTQEVDFYGVKNPVEITTSNPKLSVVNSKYEAESKHLVVTLNANDIQGETGEIILKF